MKNDVLLLGDSAIRVSAEEYLLSFEKFLRVRNNFQLHFVNNFFGDIYREQAAYQKCMAENTVVFKSLVRKIKRAIATDSVDLMYVMYGAYTMMRPHAATNWEMFI